MSKEQPPRNNKVSLNRAPVLLEVLKRSTKPPVDLYCYYLFLQRESSEDVLDFWLDVQQHENLCRAYFKDIRKQGREIRDDWPRYYSHAREYGSIYSRTTGIVQREEWEDESDENDEAGVDDLLAGGIEKEWRGGLQSGHAEKLDDDDDEEMSDQQHPQATTSEDNQFLSTSKNNNPHDRSMMRTPSPSSNGPSPVYPLSPTLRAIYPHDANELGVNDRPASRRPRASTTQPYIPRSAAINRTDLIASAERIYTRYLLPGATKEIYLPVSIRINSFPLSSSTLPSVHHPSYEIESTAQARVPDMFSRQKDYVYEQMARESFPRFIRTKVWGNLTRTSGLIRLSAGLFALWVGLSTAFAFIFLDVVPRSTRLWIILPFTVAIFNILAHIWGIDVLLVFMGLSEISTFHTITIREPYVRKLLFGRALWITFSASVIIACLTVLFYFVPGHRL